VEAEGAEPLHAAAPVEPDAPLFADLGVRSETVEALASVGITRAFAIQALTLPIALGGHDLIGQARTGTGKTLGFGIPLLQVITAPAEGGNGVPQALVVVPTRELCVQVTNDLAAAGRTRGVRVLAVYGGRAYEPQVEALRKGVEVVVGTPGRLLDLARQGHLRLGSVRVLVLDEADEMLDLGFLPDIERILAMVPESRHTMLFSATMPGPIVTLSRRFLRQPTHIRAEHPDEGRTVPETAQHIFRAHAMDKAEMLARILQAEGRGLAMVFCRTKRTAAKVADDLVERGFAAAAVHGDLGQGQREQALRAFRSGKVDVLVATDVAARGIDVSGVTHVINYQCPEDEKVYLHRIGRTGRAGGSGIAVTFVDWDDLPRWQLINTALDLPFPEPPETYSTSSHLYESLGIPAPAAGRLPRSQQVRAGLDAEQVEDLGETGRRTRRTTTRSDRPERADRPERSDRGRDTGPSSGNDPLDRPAGPGRARRRTRGSGGAGALATTDSPNTGGGMTGGGMAGGGMADPGQSGAPDGAGAGPALDGASETAAPRRRRRGGRGRGRGGSDALEAAGESA